MNRRRATTNPIIEWTDEDVWDFIKAEGIPYCSLYNEGFTRLGCVACPLAGRKDREHELIRWPKIKDAYMHAFSEMIKERERKGKLTGSWRKGTRAIDVYNWWMTYDVMPGQINLFEDYEEEEED